ncbi:MAG TPA: PfkB family carbohydrate kinase, partial [Verrucomicrobiae bacterium]|nr:PfkB family carbohydrate kinase [Verrucomicrobiae bacterium]
ETQEHAARHVIQRGWAEVVLLPLGAGGVLMATAEESVRLRAPGLPVRNRIGVGDSLVAGTVAGLAAGKPLREAVTFGVAAAGATLQAPTPELCTLEQAEAVLSSMTQSPR